MYSKYILEFLIVGLIPIVNGEDAVESTRAGNGDDCNAWRLVGGEKKTKPCVFPFYFKRFRYDKCTNIEEEFFWCSTDVDENGNHKEGNWGICNDECPTATNKECSSNSDCLTGELCNWSRYCTETKPGPYEWQLGHATGDERDDSAIDHFGNRTPKGYKEIYIGQFDSPEECRKEVKARATSGLGKYIPEGRANGLIYGGGSDQTLNAKECYAIQGMRNVDSSQVTWISSYLWECGTNWDCPEEKWKRPGVFGVSLSCDPMCSWDNGCLCKV